MYILSGDIGGTHTRLALGSAAHGGIAIEQRETFSSPAFTSLGEIVGDYLSAHQIEASVAAFGVAGPVREGISRITNLPWEISVQALRQQLGLRAVYLMNDLEALAWGIECLAEDELVSLHAGDALANGNRAVIAAGTGLGQAGLYAGARSWHPFATEGGHCDFAPETEREWRLLQHLHRQFTHVSWERVLSGPGLVGLYEFLLLEHNAATPDWLSSAETTSGAEITARALHQSDALCVEALRWFVHLYGREAGNIALKMNATGGVFLGGGIAPQILPALQDGTFVEAFLNKGRMRPLLEDIPVKVVCSDLVALQGLSHYATLKAGAK